MVVVVVVGGAGAGLAAILNAMTDCKCSGKKRNKLHVVLERPDGFQPLDPGQLCYSV